MKLRPRGGRRSSQHRTPGGDAQLLEGQARPADSYRDRYGARTPSAAIFLTCCAQRFSSLGRRRVAAQLRRAIWRTVIRATARICSPTTVSGRYTSRSFPDPEHRLPSN